MNTEYAERIARALEHIEEYLMYIYCEMAGIKGEDEEPKEE